MKIGVTQIILGKYSLDEVLQLCQDAGYEAVELVFSEGGDPDINMSDDEIRGVRKKCDDAGIEVGSSLARYAERGSLLDPDPAVREQGTRSLVRSAEIANVLGVDAILLHPGQLTAGETYQQAWDWMLGIMKEVAPVAEEKGVSIGVENVWNKFLLSPREMAQFVDAVERPLAAMVATLPTDVITAAEKRGQARDLEATVVELLAELEENNNRIS